MLLNKSHLTACKQCPKRLWLQVNCPELQHEAPFEHQGVQFKQEILRASQHLLGGGHLVCADDLDGAVAQTQAVLAESVNHETSIFEATFVAKNVVARCNILQPKPRGWRMIEVKASTSIRPYHLDDCAIQVWVLQECGVKLHQIELAHVNQHFEYQGDGKYFGLLTYEKLESRIQPLLSRVPTWIEQAQHVLAQETVPDIATGAHCHTPFSCPFLQHCNTSKSQLPQPEYPLDILYRMSAIQKNKLRAKGYQDARDVPTEQLTPTQQWVQRVSQTGQAERIPALELQQLSYPCYYLDFETINFAVPPWRGIKPYRTHVPFQWSCHIEVVEGELQHKMFLDISNNDPRRVCAELLIETLGQSGAIFVYSQVFEKGRINELALLFPDLAEALHAINQRIVDLLPIARVHYYHPKMKGSWSLKSVLPTIVPELDYQHLLVGNGEDVQYAYREIMNPETSELQREKLLQALRDYCQQDTLALVKLRYFLQADVQADIKE